MRWGFAGEKAGLEEEEWDLVDGSGTACFAGKAFFCQGARRVQMLLSNRELGDKGDNKAGRSGACQPGLVSQCPTTWEQESPMDGNWVRVQIIRQVCGDKAGPRFT